MHQAQRESALDPIRSTPSTMAEWCPFDDHVRISPWIDPVVDRRGRDPRSTYVERTGSDYVFASREFAFGGVS